MLSQSENLPSFLRKEMSLANNILAANEITFKWNECFNLPVLSEHFDLNFQKDPLKHKYGCSMVHF